MLYRISKMQATTMHRELDTGQWLLRVKAATQEAICKERIEHTQKLLTANQERSQWNFGGKVVSWLFGSSLVALGVFALMTGVGVGTGCSLIAAGGASLAIEIAEECGAWRKLVMKLAPHDKAEREKIMMHLQIWTKSGLALLSLAAMWNAAQVVTNVFRTMTVVTASAQNFAGGTIKIGVSVKDEAKLDHERQAILARSRLQQERKHEEVERNSLKKQLDDTQRVNKTAITAIETEARVSREIAHLLSRARGG